MHRLLRLGSWLAIGALIRIVPACAPPACGATGQPCCDGTCERGNDCLVGASNTLVCAACGVDGVRCCRETGCDAPLVCRRTSFVSLGVNDGVCSPCGGDRQPCCPSGEACIDRFRCGPWGIGDPFCTACGGENQVCCDHDACGDGLVCDVRGVLFSSPHCARCGGYGQLCCGDPPLSCRAGLRCGVGRLGPFCEDDVDARVAEDASAGD